MAAEGQNLQAKYQKLAQEFSKLRAQNTVLKKAVIDEQEKVRSSQENIKQKDQSIRKYEQEIDSLQFRNDQLSKRVTILQDELDVGSNGRRGRPGKRADGVPRSLEDDVRDEELSIKIEENEKLQRQLYEASQEHKAVMMNLQERLDTLERERANHQKVLDETNERHKMVVERLQQERAMLEVKLQKVDENLHTANVKAEKSQQQLKILHKEMTSRYDTVSKVVAEKVSFNDTCVKEFNSLNVPTHDRKHQMKAKEVVGQALILIKDFTGSLSDFHTYTEQRLKVFPIDSSQENLSPVHQKLCTFLHANAHLLRAIPEALAQFHNSFKEDALVTLETATGLQGFAEAIHKYAKYLEKILPYHLLSIEEECSLSSCVHSLRERNKSMIEAFARVVSAFSKVDTYVSLLASASMKSSSLPFSNQGACFMFLNSALTTLQVAIKDLSTNFHTKISIENQQPTITKYLKNTNDCIVTSLVSMMTSTERLVKFMNSNLDFFASKAGFRTRGTSIADKTEGGTSPAVVFLRQKSASYLQRTFKSPVESVPYSLALHNHKNHIHSTESQSNLSKQVSFNQERIAALEQEKEHWMLESQLLQVKYEKELKKVAGFEDEMSKLKRDFFSKSPSKHVESLEIAVSQSRATPDKPTGRKSPPPPSQQSSLGSVDSQEGVQMSEEETRESLIKNHYNSRITELTSQVQMTNSKLAVFQSECNAIYNQMIQAQQQSEKTEKELETANSKISLLEDELETTKRSYEEQLSMMSDHLCRMNEKLTSQTDEIDSLKMKQPARKGKKH